MDRIELLSSTATVCLTTGDDQQSEHRMREDTDMIVSSAKTPNQRLLNGTGIDTASEILEPVLTVVRKTLDKAESAFGGRGTGNQSPDS